MTKGPLNNEQGLPLHSRAFALEARRKNATFRNTGLRGPDAPGRKMGQSMYILYSLYIYTYVVSCKGD